MAKNKAFKSETVHYYGDGPPVLKWIQRRPFYFKLLVAFIVLTVGLIPFLIVAPPFAFFKVVFQKPIASRCTTDEKPSTSIYVSIGIGLICLVFATSAALSLLEFASTGEICWTPRRRIGMACGQLTTDPAFTSVSVALLWLFFWVLVGSALNSIKSLIRKSHEYS